MKVAVLAAAVSAVLFVAGADATRSLAPEASFADLSPAVSPDALRIAFIRVGITPRHLIRASSLYVADANGRGAVALTRGSAFSASNTEVGHYDAVTGVSWSPDGRRLVYAHAITGSRYDVPHSELVVADADGSNAFAITGAEVPPNFYAIEPAWSPKADEIAFSEGGSLWTVHPDGGSLTKLTPGPSDAWPAWSPDATKIAFVHGGNLAVMNATGAGLHIFDLPGSSAPAWSVDGSQIVFASSRSTRPSDPPDIYLVRPDGTGLQRLTSGKASDVTPTWTPHGQILFASTRGRGVESSDLWLMDRDGSNGHRLVARAARNATNGRRCTILGTVAADDLVGAAAGDVLCGLGGSDRVSGGGGADVVDGGSGKDVLDGGAGNDLILARDSRKDIVRGGPGFDRARVDRGDTVSGVERLLR